MLLQNLLIMCAVLGKELSEKVHLDLIPPSVLGAVWSIRYYRDVRDEDSSSCGQEVPLCDESDS